MCIALCERERWGERGREREREREGEGGGGEKAIFCPKQQIYNNFSVFSTSEKRTSPYIKNRNCCPPGVLYINRGSTVYCIYK